MKKYKIELTSPQIIYLANLLDKDKITNPELSEVITDILASAEPIQQKVWLPFTTLKDGGTYLTRDGREIIVIRHPMEYWESLKYPWRYKSNVTACWTKAGRYYGEDTDSPFDLILELQPSEEQTTE